MFGLVGICPVVRMEDQGFDQLKKDVVAYMDEVYPDKKLSFKVEARRARKSYPKTSMEINCDLGEAILDAFPETHVDVHKPDVMLHVCVFTDHSGSRRNAGWNKWKCHASSVRRH